MFEWKSIRDVYPKITGWYSVLICYSPEEGFFPSAEYFEDGFKNKFVSHFGEMFKSYEEAFSKAYDNDPNW